MIVEVYSKDGCSYCVRAKQLLTNKKISYKEYKLGEDGIDRAFIQEKVGKPISTVPQIFIDGNHIGGYTELEKYLR
jgi:glutaredoxin 1